MTKGVVLLAGGKSTRFDPYYLKTLYKINQKTLTEIVLENIIEYGLFDEIILVYNQTRKREFKDIAKKFKNVILVKNGETRFDSAFNGATHAQTDKLIFIDVAAPFFTKKLLEEMLNIIKNCDGLICASQETRADQVEIKDGQILDYKARNTMLRIKSFQGVDRKVWLDIASKRTRDFPEMTEILFLANKKVKYLIWEIVQKKITTKNDLKFLNEQGWIDEHQN